MRSNLGLLRWAVCTLPLLSACDGAGETRFRALALTVGDQPIHRNQDLELLFSAPLSDSPQPASAVRVLDDRGRNVPINVTAVHRVLVIRPRAAEGWPVSAHLDLDLPYPRLGPSIRSSREEENEEPFHVRVRLSPTYMRRPGLLELRSIDPLGPDPLDFSDPEQRMRLTFNADLDPRSLSGIQVVDVEHIPPMVLGDLRIDVDPALHNVARIHTFADGASVFAGGRAYRVQLTPALRSRDGRRLAPGTPHHPFRTSPGAGGFLVVAFREESDLDPRSRGAFPADGRLRPLGVPHPVVWPPESPNATFSAIDALFTSEPSRAQILIEGAFLPEVPSLIRGVVFHAKEPIAEGSAVDDFAVRVGYASPGGLSHAFDSNAARCTRARTLTVGEGTGNLRLDHATTGDGRPLWIAFDQPFVYDGSGRPLLLDLDNRSGVSEPRGRRSIPIEGVQSAGPWRMVVRRGAEGEFPTTFAPRLLLLTEKFEPIVTRFFEVPNHDGPVRFRRVASGFRGRGVEPQDFRILFQGGRPGPDGTLEATTPWSETLPRGCPAIRLEISFEPRSSSDAFDDGLPWIESLTLHYEHERMKR